MARRQPRVLSSAPTGATAVQNAKTAQVKSVPLFSELLLRCRDDIPQFARDFLDIDLHEGQIKWVNTRPWAHERYLAAGNRFGKATPNFEPVLTPDGWKPIGDIQVGDQVYSQDGTACDVIGVFPQGERHTYRFVFDDNASILSADDHLWLVKTGEARFRKVNDRTGEPNPRYGESTVMTTKDILERWGPAPKPRRRISIPVVEPVQFPPQHIPYDPYLLGLLLGNGCFVQTTVTFTSADAELVAAFGDSLRTIDSRKNAHIIHGVVDIVRRLGLHGHRAWDKFVPPTYLWNDVPTRLAILQGLMDTDGTISSGTANVEYSTTSEQLAKDVLFIVQSLGGKGKITSRRTTFTYKGERRLGRVSYRVDFRIPGICPFRLKRKADRWHEKGFTKERILTRIEDGGMYTCTCIAVNHPSRLYVTKDFIVTHNSFCAAIKLLHNAFFQVRPQKYSYRTDEYIAINLSITIDQACIVWNHCLRMALSSPILSQFVVADETKNYPFPNLVLGRGKGIERLRSQIWARSSSKGAIFILGHKFDFVNWDEAARDPEGQRTLDDVIRMRLVDREGRLDCTSTGDGRNWYYQAFMRALDATKNGTHEHIYYAQTGSSFENHHISKERLELNMQTMTATMIDQNIYGGFTGSSSMFPRDKLQACYKDMDWPVATQVENAQWVEGRRYGAGIDLGNSRDVTVVLVYEDTPEGGTVITSPHLTEDGRVKYYEEVIRGPRIVFAWQSEKGMDWREIYDMIARISRAYHHPPMLFDATGPGGKLHGENLRQDRNLHNVIPYDFSGTKAKKEHLLTVAQQYVQQALIHWPYSDTTAPLYEQLAAYDADDKHLSTDWVMSFAMMCECHRANFVARLPITTLSLPTSPIRLRRSFGFGSTDYLARRLDSPDLAERVPAFMERQDA